MAVNLDDLDKQMDENLDIELEHVIDIIQNDIIKKRQDVCEKEETFINAKEWAEEFEKEFKDTVAEFKVDKYKLIYELKYRNSHLEY